MNDRAAGVVVAALMALPYRTPQEWRAWAATMKDTQALKDGQWVLFDALLAQSETLVEVRDGMQELLARIPSGSRPAPGGAGVFSTGACGAWLVCGPWTGP